MVWFQWKKGQRLQEKKGIARNELYTGIILWNEILQKQKNVVSLTNKHFISIL